MSVRAPFKGAKIETWRPAHGGGWWWYAFSVRTGGMTGTADTQMAADADAERWLESKLKQ